MTISVIGITIMAVMMHDGILERQWKCSGIEGVC